MDLSAAVELPHTASVRAYLGHTATGPQFAAAVDVDCYAEDRRRLVRARDGSEVVSETTIWVDPSVNCPAESEVTVNGRTTTALTVSRFDYSDATPNHQEIALR